MRIQTTKVYSRIQHGIDAGYTTISEQGSSRSSKTYNTLIWLIVYCLLHSGTRLSIVRKTLPSIKGSVFIDFREILIKKNGPLGCQAHEPDGDDVPVRQRVMGGVLLHG